MGRCVLQDLEAQLASVSQDLDEKSEGQDTIIQELQKALRQSAEDLQASKSQSDELRSTIEAMQTSIDELKSSSQVPQSDDSEQSALVDQLRSDLAAEAQSSQVE